jgi:acyl-CoA dehydrogenase
MSALAELPVANAQSVAVRGDWRKLVTEVAAIAAAHADAVDREGRFPFEAIQAMRDTGLLNAWIPQEVGGPGLGLREIAAMCQQLGTSCGASAMIFAMHHIQLSSVVYHGGSSAFYRDLLQRMLVTPMLLASVTSEVGVGGDIRRSIAHVVRNGDGFEVSKHGSVVSYGAYADGLLITARADEQAPPNGQVLLTVLKEQYQLEKTGQWDSMGMRGTCSDAFQVRAKGRSDQIFEAPFSEIIAANVLPVSHILWSSLWFGIAHGAVLKVRNHLRTLMKQSGNLPPAATALPDLVAELQLLHARLLSALCRYETALGAGHAQAMSMSLTTDLTLLKRTMSEGCLAVVQKALTTAGYGGYSNSSPVSLSRPLRDLHSAPLMINNARLVETMSSFLLMDPLQFGMA